MSNTYAAAMAELSSQPLDCDRAWLERVLAAPQPGTPIKPVAVARRGAGSSPQSYDVILSLVGFMTDRPSLFTAIFGGTVITEFLPMLERYAADPAVKKILVDVDSPGGLASAGHGVNAGISSAAKIKPVIAIVNPYAASAAYHAIAGSSLILSVFAGHVGSIGTFMQHVDVSEALEKEGVKITYISSTLEKTEMAGHIPLTKEARVHEQRNVDSLYTSFVRNVARGRGVTPAKVKADFGHGRLLLAEDALKGGMIDAIIPSFSEGLRIAGKFPTHNQRREADLARMEANLRTEGYSIPTNFRSAAATRAVREWDHEQRELELQALERGLV